MKVAFVEPQIASSSQTIFAGNNALEPLGLEYLASVAISMGWESRVFVERILQERLVDDLVAYKPDVVGFTSLTCNSHNTKKLAYEIKRCIGCTTVVGGYHASAIPEDFAQEEYIDWVVSGEGETAIRRILSANHVGEKKNIYNKILRLPRFQDINALIEPVREKNILENCRLLGLMFPAPSVQKRVAIVSTSRGCHNKCDFCATRSVWGDGVVARRLPMRIVDEMQELIYSYGVDAFFLGDLSFNSSLTYISEICQLMIDNGISVPWYCMCCMKGIPKDILALMSEAGCRKIGIGIENPAMQIRKAIKDGYVAADDEIISTIEAAHSNEIIVKGYFMVGYPWETPETLESFESALIHFPFDEIKISFYTPFPGTKLFEQYKEQLVTRDWSAFDTVSHAVLQMEGVTSEEIIDWRNGVFNRFYSSSMYKNHMKDMCNKNSSLRRSYTDFARQLESAGLCGVVTS